MTTSIYVLECPKGLYVGIAKDVYHRLESHRKGQSRLTKSLGAEEFCELIHVWEAPDRLWALRWEKYLQLFLKFHKQTDETRRELYTLINDCPVWCDIFKDCCKSMQIKITAQDLKYLNN